MRTNQRDYSYLIARRVKDVPDVVQNDFRNVAGRRIFTIGDVHGAPAFQDVMRFLEQGHIAVSVGDLMDRGPDTFEILQAIATGPLKDNIIAVRGNHEEMFLRHMAARRKRAGDPNVTLTKEEESDIQFFFWNGGEWARNKTLAELEPIADYVDQLPYIRRNLLRNDRKFLVCHADLSMLSDEEIEQLLNGQKKLTAQEKAALTWSRGKLSSSCDISYNVTYTKVRTPHSTRVYVGHDITIKSNVSVVRTDTNHVDLDFGAYSYGPLVGVEHPDKILVFGVFKKDCDQEDKHRFFDQLVKLYQCVGKIEFHAIETFEAYKAYLNHNMFALVRTCCLNLSYQNLSAEMTLDMREIPKASLGNVIVGRINKNLKIQITPEQAIYYLNKENLNNCKLISRIDLKNLCTLLKEKLNTHHKPNNLHALLEFIINQAKQLQATADFSGVNFSGCDFSHLDLSHVRLQHCNLSHAKFNNTTFLNVSPKAFLEMVDLKYAELLKYEKNPWRHNFLYDLMKGKGTEFEKIFAILEHARKEPRSLTALVLEQAVKKFAEPNQWAVGTSGSQFGLFQTSSSRTSESTDSADKKLKGP